MGAVLIFVGHYLATKVFIGKLLVTRGKRLSCMTETVPVTVHILCLANSYSSRGVYLKVHSYAFNPGDLVNSLANPRSSGRQVFRSCALRGGKWIFAHFGHYLSHTACYSHTRHINMILINVITMHS